MKKVLFILHEYYPKGSAITNCLDPIINEMKKQNVKISVLTRKQSFCLKDYEIIDDVEIFRIPDWFNLSIEKINSTKNKIEKLFYKLLLRTIGIYRNRIIKDSIGFFNKKRAIKMGKNIYNKFKYDTIISCSFPFSTHKIAYRLSNYYKINWFAYQFDPHSFNYTLNPKLINHRLKEEIKILSSSNKIFLPKENYEENIKTKLNILKDKYYPIDFALIKENNYNYIRDDNKKIVFVFAGTFYESIRMPDKLLEFFKNVNFDYELNLYYLTEKVVEDVILEYKKILKDKLVLYKNKSKSECDDALKKADIIINVGNSVANQTPSKIFELISLGKPIINFYNIQNDTSKKVLKKYPLVFNIYKEYERKIINQFEEFCLINKGKKISFEEISQKYKTADTIAKEFIEEVRCCSGK